MGNQPPTIDNVVIDLAENYKLIGVHFRLSEQETNYFRMRYDTEVYEYIRNFASDDRQKEVLIELYKRHKEK